MLTMIYVTPEAYFMLTMIYVTPEAFICVPNKRVYV